ncbi:hypothetical protein NMY22_g13980 [Coprinellus aureogranulatus]|nr:hypothetical protein NMY22_g13980 [Coprinellus aureogranulatus]
MSTDIRLDPSDPLNILLQNPVGGDSSSSSNGDDSGASSVGSPQDWTQLSTLWDGTDPTATLQGGGKYNDLMDFNDLNGTLDMNMDMEFDPTMGLHYADAVPVLGAPVKGALEACIKVQTILEKRSQNVEAVQQLVSKLKCLEQQLSNHSRPTLDDSLKKRLGEIESELQQLAANDALDYDHVASFITQCEKDIAFVMAQLSLVGHAETQAVVADLKRQFEAKFNAQSEQITLLLQAFAASQAANIGLAVVPLVVWELVDPFGTKHRFIDLPRTSYTRLGNDNPRSAMVSIISSDIIVFMRYQMILHHLALPFMKDLADMTDLETSRTVPRSRALACFTSMQDRCWKLNRKHG